MRTLPRRSGAPPNAYHHLNTGVGVYTFSLLSRFILSGWLLTTLIALPCKAQFYDDPAIETQPVETTITGDDLAFRLRGEFHMSDDSSDVVEQDINYARFPLAMYSGEAALFRNDGFYATWSSSYWRNRQDLDVSYWNLKVGMPPVGAWRFMLKHQFRNEPGILGWENIYLGAGRSLWKSVYWYSQYRHTFYNGEGYQRQAYEYLNWKISDRLRLGVDGSWTWNIDGGQAYAQHERIFTSLFLLKDWTSLRVEAMRYDTAESVDFDEYDIYLYQKIWSSSLLRLGLRMYSDTDDITSTSWSIKAKHYFTPRFSVDGGYRYYDQSEGANLNTVFGGFSLTF